MRDLFKKIIIKILALEARWVLRKYKPHVVAITGSVGKTSTKDAVYAVLSRFAHVRKSDKSFNSEFGVPLTILGLPNGYYNPVLWIKNIIRGLWIVIWKHPYPKWLVLEVGVQMPGDMRFITRFVHGEHVVFTAFADNPAHVEFFPSREALYTEKMQLVDILPDDGTIHYNHDSKELAKFFAHLPENKKVQSYGLQNPSDLSAMVPSLIIDENEKEIFKLEFRVKRGDENIQVTLPGVFSEASIYSALAAISVATAAGYGLQESADALKRYLPPPSRMRALHGQDGSILIDDTYNSSPMALAMSLRTISTLPLQGRKIVVLGDMLELGDLSLESHREAGKLAADVADIFVTYGVRARDMHESAKEAGLTEKRLMHFGKEDELVDYLKNQIKKGDTVLIKGSQGMRMERVVKALLADPTDAEKYVARQDDFWLNKK